MVEFSISLQKRAASSLQLDTWAVEHMDSTRAQIQYYEAKDAYRGHERIRDSETMPGDKRWYRYDREISTATSYKI